MLPQKGMSQDPVFSQFHMMPTILSPALVGQVDGPRFGIMYRNQWPAIGNAYETYAFAYDQYFKEIKSGIGATILADQSGNGILKNQKIQGQYAFRIETRSGWKSQLGIEVGLGHEAVDKSGLIFLDQLDPRFGPVSPGGTPYPTLETPFESFSRFYLDIGAGASLYNEKYFLTLGASHLNRPSVSFLGDQNGKINGMPILVTAMVGAKYVLRSPTRFNPNETYISPIIVYAQQGGTGQINGGLYLGTGQFVLGAYYRHANTNPDAAGLSAAVKVGNLKFGYAYDFTVSNLGISTGGSHEIGMTLAIEYKEGKYNDCFNMFR